MNSQKSGIEIVIDTSALDKVANKANEADASLDNLLNSVNEIESSLSSIGDVGVAVDIDADASGLDEIVTALDEIENNTPEAEVNASVINMDDITNLLGVLENIGAVALKVGAAVGAIGLAVGGAAISFGVKNFLDMDNALDSIEARTGKLIPQAEELIMGIYEKGWGDSREEIAGVITQMDHLNIATSDFEIAATTAFQAAEVIGADVNEVLETMNQMVLTGISPNFQSAGDVIVAGFQNGADKGNDFLSVLNQTAPIIADMGLDAESFTNILITGLDNGFTSANQVSDALVMLRTRLSDGSQEVQDTLAALNLTDLSDAYLSGQASGEQFLEGLSAALASIEDPAAQLEATNTLFGRQGRMIGQDALEGLQSIGAELGNIEGRAQQASDVLQRDFGESIQRTFRTLEDTVINFLSSDQIDLPGKLEVFEAQFQEFVANLQSGTGAGRSLELAFDLDYGAIGRIESAFNNVAIGLLQAVQSILGALRKFEEADAIGAEISRISGGQLQFDLGVVDPTQMIDSITTALSRTGDWTPVITAIQGSLDEAMANGNFAQAFSIVDAAMASTEDPALDLVFEQMGVRMADSLRPAFDEAMNTGNLVDAQAIAEGMGDIDMMLAAEEMAGQLRASFDSAMATEDFDTAALIAEQIGDPALIQQVADLGGAITETANATVAAGTATSGALEETAKAVEDYSGRSETELAANVDVWANWESPVVKTIANVDTKVTNLANKIGSLNTALGGLGEAAVPEEPTGAPHAAGGTAYGRSLVGEEGPEVVDFPNRAGIINAANSSVLMRAIDSFAASRGVGGGGSTTNIYLNNTMNAQSTSQADAFGYRLSRQVRGFSS